LNYINNLIEQSIWILRETKAQFPEDKTIELCSWGKDSISTLFLVQEAFSYFPWKIVHIDTGCKFPEMYALRDRLQKELKFDLKIIKGKGEASPEKNRFECCTRMKTEALKRDEHGIRNKERIISPRYKGKWNIWKKEGGESGTSMQDVELYSWGILESDFYCESVACGLIDNRTLLIVGENQRTACIGYRRNNDEINQHCSGEY